MKVLLPENIKEITLGQFQRYNILLNREDLDIFQFNKRKIEIFTGIRYHDLNNISNKDFENILKQIDLAMSSDVPFVDRFKIGDLEFGFIPNFDKITTKEFVDLSLYPLSDIDTYHKVMAILFRPIKKTNKLGNYKIKDYNGTDKYSELMKLSPMNVVNGAMVFFLNLSKELQKSTLKYTIAELKKDKRQRDISINGDGMQLLKK